MKKILFLCLTIACLVPSLATAAQKAGGLSLLFFFSPTCSHCQRVEPVVNELAASYRIEGMRFGQGEGGAHLSFPVRQGDRSLADKYNIHGVPVLVVLQHGKTRTILRGEGSIRDAPLILGAIREGALTVSEALARGPRRGVFITGWIEGRGFSFRDTRYFLTDRVKAVPVRPWLPREAVKAPFRKERPRLMSDVVDRPTALRGDLVVQGGHVVLVVKKEVETGGI